MAGDLMMFLNLHSSKLDFQDHILRLFPANLTFRLQFLDMSSLQATLPNPQLPPAFLGNLSQPWFPQNPVTPYISAAPQGGLPYMAGQVTSSQLPNIPSQSPVVPLGGNPFA
ncbi:probable ADP-ribosylation factor GTPase-activating protein AGD14 [Macadamia integrifolia]|uniref:probable ADP-ribosylation factor GTPase-activating protein AGD14 n=1 Tax=Macadamia integrifolia TaxID=60698 RepID=UPI001C4F2CD1|nr:probable ADP-ribosylation factor GTPase-activating protein AGD14 [Macadamia integrifolia]